MKHNFAVIGHGRVGGAILSLLRDCGFNPVWIFDVDGLHPDIPLYKKLPKEPFGANIIFITVPDDSIAAVALQISKTWESQVKNMVFFHMSGLHSSIILKPLSDLGAEVASFHPLQSIMHTKGARKALKGSIFTVEGTPRAVKTAKMTANKLGGKVVEIDKKDKVIYHAAAVVASNYMTSLLSLAENMMEDIGLKRASLIPLVKGTLANIELHGSVAALTGPIRRGDWATVGNHIKTLSEEYPDLLGLYLALGKYTSHIAGRHWRAHTENESKILDIDDLSAKVQRMKKRGYKIVFTNGCFDVIHAGHVQYLEQARNLGDCLIVGLNSDDSAKRLKGPNRPVNDQLSRAAVLAALYAVNFVCVFNEDTPYSLIKKLVPNILVKGGDWSIKDIVGSDVVTKAGGKVYSLPFKEGFSSTSIIKKCGTPIKGKKSIT